MPLSLSYHVIGAVTSPGSSLDMSGDDPGFLFAGARLGMNWVPGQDSTQRFSTNVQVIR